MTLISDTFGASVLHQGYSWGPGTIGASVLHQGYSWGPGTVGASVLEQCAVGVHPLNCWGGGM